MLFFIHTHLQWEKCMWRFLLQREIFFFPRTFFTITLYWLHYPCCHARPTQFIASLKCWTLNINKQQQLKCSVHLITKHVSASPFPPSAALISIQSECWELQQWWGQCRWMGSIPSTAWQHALYVSLHTVVNLLRWEVKWRWMAIVDLPDCLLENTKAWPPPMAFCSILPFEEAIQEFNPQNIISLPSSYEQNGRHSSLGKKKEKKKKIQFYSVGLLQPAIIQIHF